jgi:hypothetical protein
MASGPSSNPYIFSSFNTAQVISRLSQDATKYVLVKLEANADPRAVQNALIAKMRALTLMTIRLLR